MVTHPPSRIRVVIADDERPARAFLASTLSDFADVDVVGEAANGIEALRLIRSLQPDLAMLDIQMPELDGIEVAGQIAGSQVRIVFTTAHVEYAVQAEELHVVDYLLKPISPSRLRQTLDRVHDLLGVRPANE